MSTKNAQELEEFNTELRADLLPTGFELGKPIYEFMPEFEVDDLVVSLRSNKLELDEQRSVTVEFMVRSPALIDMKCHVLVMSLTQIPSPKSSDGRVEGDTGWWFEGWLMGGMSLFTPEMPRVRCYAQPGEGYLQFVTVPPTL